jgi:integrase
LPLTDIAVRTAKPSSKPVKIFDGLGMYLEVSPTGTKLWRLKYRYSGKEKRISLGTYPGTSLREAREQRDQFRKCLAAGIDPSEQRKQKKLASLAQGANCFEAIAREWHTKFSTAWNPNHSNRTINRLANHVFPRLGRRTISDITAPDLLAVLRPIEERGAIETAHRTLQICGQILRYAIVTGRATRDISQDLRGALKPTKSKHFAAVTSPEKFAGLLRKIDGYNGSLVVSSALKLAPLVFVRPGELRHAKWGEIDFEKAEWRFLVTKTNMPHIVPLSLQALDILRVLHPHTGHKEYVFPSIRGLGRPMSDNAILAALRSLGIDSQEMTGHGFRATARTLLDEELNYRADLIEHQLAHAVRDPNGRAYNRTSFLAERKEMMQAWATYLDRLKETT